MSDAIDRAAVQSAVRAYLALEDTDAAWEVERIIAALPAVSAPVAVRVTLLRDMLAYLEGEAPGITSGGQRNSELRDAILAVIDAPAPVMLADGVLSEDDIAALAAEKPGQIVRAHPAPDVAELVEAAKGVMRHMPDYADTAWQELDAALAKIKEPTP